MMQKKMKIEMTTMKVFFENFSNVRLKMNEMDTGNWLKSYRKDTIAIKVERIIVFYENAGLRWILLKIVKTQLLGFN